MKVTKVYSEIPLKESEKKVNKKLHDSISEAEVMRFTHLGIIGSDRILYNNFPSKEPIYIRPY